MDIGYVNRLCTQLFLSDSVVIILLKAFKMYHFL